MPKRKADIPVEVESNDDDAATSGDASPARLRGRPKGSGKPKKIVDPNAPKRSPGRPRINPPKDPNAPKKPRGRPPTNPSSPKKTTASPAKVTSRSPGGKRGRPAGSKNKPKKRGRKPKQVENPADQSDE